MQDSVITTNSIVMSDLDDATIFRSVMNDLVESILTLNKCSNNFRFPTADKEHRSSEILSSDDMAWSCLVKAADTQREFLTRNKSGGNSEIVSERAASESERIRGSCC